MNHLEGWKVVRELVKEAWKNWHPHFEILTSGTGRKIAAFFLLDDTEVEWNLYHSIPEEFVKDFADYVDSAKNELLERAGFKMQLEDIPANEQTASDLSADLLELLAEYEKRTGIYLPDLTFEMICNTEMI